MANLHHGEHDLLLKNEACLELEDNLQRKTEEMDVLQHRCATLQQELDDLQRKTAAESCERESIKVKWEGEGESLKDKCADLEEKVMCLSQESEASKETLELCKVSFRERLPEQSEEIDNEAKQLKHRITFLEDQLVEN